VPIVERPAAPEAAVESDSQKEEAPRRRGWWQR
jgi:hypothetical protein